MGFFATFDRPFDPVGDLSYTGIGIETCATRSAGRRRTWSSSAWRLLGVAVLALTTLAVLRLTRVAAGHRRRSLQVVTALGGVWVLCWVLGAFGTPHRLDQRRGPGRRRGAGGARRRRGPRDLRSEIGHDRFARTAGEPSC